MKKCFLILAGLVTMLGLPVRAQDAAVLEERVKRLTGYVQDLQEKSDSQQKQIEALGKEVLALREHQQSQPTTASASQEDLRDLAKKVQEIEELKADRAFLDKEFAKLAKLANAKPTTSRAEPPVRSGDTPPDLAKEALEHTIASGDTLSTIAAAYSKELGKKITPDMILRYNDGLKADRLIPNRKIKIPIPDK